MSGIVAEKLYPPTIGSTIPAFYEEQGAAVIAVPFSMNRAVETSDVWGFRLKIKTVQSNSLITTLDISAPVAQATINGDRIAKFIWKTLDENNNRVIEFNKVKVGQFLKVQMAYLDDTGKPGYFSTVAITKLTSKPNVFIENANVPGDPSAIPAFYQSYTGVYQTTEDISERPYSYCFYLFNSSKGLEETSGWKLHNTSVNRVAIESVAIDKLIDTYSFTSSVIPGETYYIQYGVKTINNLEVFSPLYPVYCAETTEPELEAMLVPSNNFDDGFVELKFDINSNVDMDDWPREGDYISIEISRASLVGVINDLDAKYMNWQVLTKCSFANYYEVENWRFRDFTVEQGIHYRYRFRQFSKNGVTSNPVLSKDIMADFEDMFLYDGVKQLKIRYNPKISSFKATKMEQKIETIGSKYPYIFKNGIVDYKEFPISGLITYLADFNELFINYATDLNLEAPRKFVRSHSPGDPDVLETEFSKELVTTAGEGYNIRAERIFKMKVLEWMNDGKIKLFRSPGEGNYFVRLVNISLTPEDRLGRMLHTVNATAYETEDFNYSNLLNLGFIKPDDPYRDQLITSGHNVFKDVINAKYVNANTSIRINDYLIRDVAELVPTPRSTSQRVGFFIRVGLDNPENKVYISGPRLRLKASGAELPDIWFNPNDNLEILNNLVDKDGCLRIVGDAVLNYSYLHSELAIGSFRGISSITVKNKIETRPGPATINFGNVAITNQALNIIPRILKFWVLEFEAKNCTTQLLYKNGKYYYYDQQTIEVKTFDKTQLYQVKDNNTNKVGIYFTRNGTSLELGKMKSASPTVFYANNAAAKKDIDMDVTLSCNRALTDSERATLAREQFEIQQRTDLTTAQKNALITELTKRYPPYSVTFNAPPKINLYEAIDYNSITLNWGVFMKAAYQERTVTYTS